MPQMRSRIYVLDVSFEYIHFVRINAYCNA